MSAHLRIIVYCTPVFKIHKLSKYFSNKSKISDHVLNPANASEHSGGASPLKITCKQSQQCLVDVAMTLVPIKMEFLHKYGEIIKKTCIKIILMLLQINVVINNLVTIF